jgi:hypothetical protein
MDKVHKHNSIKMVLLEIIFFAECCNDKTQVMFGESVKINS